MPLKLNIVNAACYAVVEQPFIDLMKVIWKDRWKAMNEELKAQLPQYRAMAAKSVGPQMARLKALCTNHVSLDKEITRLRGLPYEQFYTRQWNGQRWLCGLTRPIVMTDDVRKYQAPRYTVYIPDDVDTKGTDAAFHFVPEGHELTTVRHPHHNCLNYRYDSMGYKQEMDLSGIMDPLDHIPATCWGSFGTIAQSCTKSGDIVDLFRNIGIYLTRINQNSLLTRPFGACHFLVDIGPADPKPEQADDLKARFIDKEKPRRRR